MGSSGRLGFAWCGGFMVGCGFSSELIAAPISLTRYQLVRLWSLFKHYERGISVGENGEMRRLPHSLQ